MAVSGGVKWGRFKVFAEWLGIGLSDKVTNRGTWSGGEGVFLAQGQPGVRIVKLGGGNCSVTSGRAGHALALVGGGLRGLLTLQEAPAGVLLGVYPLTRFGEGNCWGRSALSFLEHAVGSFKVNGLFAHHHLLISHPTQVFFAVCGESSSCNIAKRACEEARLSGGTVSGWMC